ncbi:MAG TPA: M3 family oligoendopeptidase [Candidatus Limnocylindria bacterium]|nr:M3 family oligoendopeptidase [Candidatus Limnocylindria bacterium]
MSLLPFGDLPPFRKPAFVPATIDLGNWPEIEPLFAELERRAPLCLTTAELEKWLLDQAELTAALDEEKARRYIAMTCHTDDPTAEASFLGFAEKIEPEVKPWQFKLDELFLHHPLRNQLPPSRYLVFNRKKKTEAELFRPENVALETDETKLTNEYQKLSGSLTVQFRGEEKTLVAMGRFQEMPDRGLREEAWRAVAARRLQERDNFERIFDDMLALREKIAHNAGFSSYLDYAFKLRGRFDYTREDCLRFHDAIEAEVMPAIREIQKARKIQLGVDTLRPWDLGVDPQGRAPLKPFTDTAEMERGTQEIFNRLDPDLARGFTELRDNRLLDLANRKGKAPGGYQYTLNRSRVPFIFMNSVGLQRDVETILHEAGHAFHALACREDDLTAYREAPIEFCEVASMSMELIGADHLDVFYSEADARRARLVHLEGVIGVFPWIATVDAFQHWIYTHPGHTHAERSAAWTALMDRFGGDVDWSGFEDVRANLWHRQLHIFIHPFYYVEYGIAQVGALQVWANSRHHPQKALADYKAGLALGGSRTLPELFAAAGCHFDFSAGTLRPLIDQVRQELDRLANGQAAS